MQYVEDLSASLQIVFVAVIFLMSKARGPPKYVCQLTILKTGLLVPLKEQQLL